MRSMTRGERWLLGAAVVLVLVVIFRDAFGLSPHPALGPLFIGVLVGMLLDLLLLRLPKVQQVVAVGFAISLAGLLAVLAYAHPEVLATGQGSLYAVAFSSSLLASATGYALGREVD